MSFVKLSWDVSHKWMLIIVNSVISNNSSAKTTGTLERCSPKRARVTATKFYLYGKVLGEVDLGSFNNMAISISVWLTTVSYNNTYYL